MDRPLPGLEPVVRPPEEIALPAMEEHEPVAVYALLSGGHDSAAVARWAAEHLDGPNFKGLVHINTRIGVEETREYVHDLAKFLGLPLRIEFGQQYERVVREFGFPGPGFHGLPYARLKERAIRKLVAEAKVGHHRRSRVALISGVRRQESVRRMGLDKPVNRTGSQLWVNPFFDYDKSDLNDYRKSKGVPDNDAALLLGKSGECYCGAFARPGELEQTTALGFPKVERQIRKLEARLRSDGHPACRWGERPPERIAEKQREAGQLELLDSPMQMCVGCGSEPQHEVAA